MMTAQLRYELKEWMESNENLFPVRPMPMGKLTAFFDWKMRMEFTAAVLKGSK